MLNNIDKNIIINLAMLEKHLGYSKTILTKAQKVLTIIALLEFSRKYEKYT